MTKMQNCESRVAEGKVTGNREQRNREPGAQEQTQARTQGSLELHGKCVKKEVLEKEQQWNSNLPGTKGLTGTL